MLMVVVLPAPFGPRRPKISPPRIARLTPPTASRSPNALWRSRASTTVSVRTGAITAIRPRSSLPLASAVADPRPLAGRGATLPRPLNAAAGAPATTPGRAAVRHLRVAPSTPPALLPRRGQVDRRQREREEQLHGEIEP